jgi:hypothetical protein
MPEVYLTKTFAGLVPCEENSRAWFAKLKPGEVVHAAFKRCRNYKFLKKYFALLNVGFENWEPGEVDSKHGKPEKNFDRFRADCTILAGYFETTIRLDGSVRIEPKSISFANMEEEEFEKLYSATINVFLKHVYGAGMSREEVDRIVNQYMEFA